MSHREITDAYGLPLGTVKSGIRLAFVALRRLIDPAHRDFATGTW